MPNNRGNKHTGCLYMLLILALMAMCIVSLSVGAAAMPIKSIFEAVSRREGTNWSIIAYIRVPRMIGSLLAGAGLAASGCIIQSVMNNPMAGPGIIGVNAGAGFATLACMALFPHVSALLPSAAFMGAVCCTLFIYAVAGIMGASKMKLILVGVAVSSMLSAASSLIKELFPDIITAANTFSVGSLSGVNYDVLIPAALYILPCIALSVLLGRNMDVLSLGEETANSIGLNVQATRFALLVTAAMLAGAAVSFAGLIGFVGLIVPHIAKAVFGSGARRAVLGSALIGALLVLVCDTLGRVLFSPYELSAGILISLIGGPYFLYMLMKNSRGKANA